jgi:hypothetical protein
VIDLVFLGTGFQPYFFDDGPMVRPALAAGSHRGREGRVLAALLALNQDVLGAPPVDLAHLYILNLVVRFDTLNHFRHLLSSFPSTRLLSAHTGDTFSRAEKDFATPEVLSFREDPFSAVHE